MHTFTDLACLITSFLRLKDIVKRQEYSDFGSTIVRKEEYSSSVVESGVQQKVDKE